MPRHSLPCALQQKGRTFPRPLPLSLFCATSFHQQPWTSAVHQRSGHQAAAVWWAELERTVSYGAPVLHLLPMAQLARLLANAMQAHGACADYADKLPNGSSDAPAWQVQPLRSHLLTVIETALQGGLCSVGCSADALLAVGRALAGARSRRAFGAGLSSRAPRLQAALGLMPQATAATEERICTARSALEAAEALQDLASLSAAVGYELRSEWVRQQVGAIMHKGAPEGEAYVAMMALLPLLHSQPAQGLRARLGAAVGGAARSS